MKLKLSFAAAFALLIALPLVYNSCGNPADFSQGGQNQASAPADPVLTISTGPFTPARVHLGCAEYIELLPVGGEPLKLSVCADTAGCPIEFKSTGISLGSFTVPAGRYHQLNIGFAPGCTRADLAGQSFVLNASAKYETNAVFAYIVRGNLTVSQNTNLLLDISAWMVSMESLTDPGNISRLAGDNPGTF